MRLPPTITRAPHHARQTQSTSTLVLTSTRSSGDSNILASSVADTNLLWWQLLALIAGGVLALGVGIWWWNRHRRRQREDQARKAEVERAERESELEKRRKKEEEDEERRRMRRRARRKGSYDSEIESDWSDGSEDYDSVSDGGTIRPRRRRRRRRNRRRHRRRSSSDYSDDSDTTYVPRRKERRDSPPSSPPKPVPDGRSDKAPNFRDSVFSTYTSMKNAAVKLKYVEAKVKLKKQLEEEERIEADRRAKIAGANKELEEARRREVDSAASSKHVRNKAHPDQPLIPPARRLTASSGSRTALPTPPPRAIRKATYPPPANIQSLRRMPRQSSADSCFPRSSSQPATAQKPELGDEISRLLGANGRTAPQQLTRADEASTQAPKPQRNPIAAWLTRPHPNTSPSVPSSPNASVYVPMNHPRDRPIIPKGQLVLPPKPKPREMVREAGGLEQVSEGSGPYTGFTGGSATPSRKWADRLRDRR